MASTKTASPAEVREWAKENGLKVGTRGKLPPEVIQQFNKGRRVKYRVGEFEKTIQVRGIRVNGNGRKVPVRRTATPAEIRAAASANGVDLGERGRLSADVKAAFAAGEYDNN